MIARSKDTPGVDTLQGAAVFWFNEWDGGSFMAIGMKDQMLGPNVMNFLRTINERCPERLKIENGGHFEQEASGHLFAE